MSESQTRIRVSFNGQEINPEEGTLYRYSIPEIDTLVVDNIRSGEDLFVVSPYVEPSYPKKPFNRSIPITMLPTTVTYPSGDSILIEKRT